MDVLEGKKAKVFFVFKAPIISTLLPITLGLLLNIYDHYKPIKINLLSESMHYYAQQYNNALLVFGVAFMVYTIGFVLGIYGIVGMRNSGRKGMMSLAILGTLFNGVSLCVIVFILILLLKISL